MWSLRIVEFTVVVGAGVADFRQTIKSGSLDDLRPGEFGVVLGADLARALRVFTGDKVTVIAPQGTVTPAGVVPRLKSFRAVSYTHLTLPTNREV